MNLGNRLDDLAKAAGLSAAKASKDAGLSSSFIRDLKRGVKKSVSVEKLQALAAVLGVTVSYILKEEGHPLSLSKDNLTAVAIPDGRVVHIAALSETIHITDGTPVVAQVGNLPPDLYQVSTFGSVDVLYPMHTDGSLGPAVTYDPGDEWHTGSALLDGQPCRYRIMGVARWISAPCSE